MTIRAPPIGGGENLEGWDIPSGSSEPFPSLSHPDLQIDVFAFHMDVADFHVGKGLQEAIHIGEDLPPFQDRILFIQEACLDDLIPVFFHTHSHLFRHLLSPIQSDGPRQLPGILFPLAGIHVEFCRHLTRHDLPRIDSFQLEFIPGRFDSNEMIARVHDLQEIILRKESDLFGGSVFVDDPLPSFRDEIRDIVSSGFKDGSLELEQQRFRAF